MTDDQRPPEQPGGGGQPEQPEHPAVEQPTTAWTPPEQPTPAWTPPPAGAPPTPPEPTGTGWTPPEQPTPAWTPPASATPPPPPIQPADQPAPNSGGKGPLLSATPATPVATGWAQPADLRREVAPGLVFSGTAARFVAYWIDALLLAVVSGIFTSTIGSGARFDSSGGLVWTTGDVIASILGVAINGAYFVGFWSGGRRATLGQMLLKIQVANAFDGKSLTLEQAVRRWLGLGQFLSLFAVSATAIGLIGLVSVVWTLVLFISTVTSPTKQGLHDRFANSAVVRPANAGNGLVYTCLFILVGLPIIALLAIIALIFLGGQVSSILSNPAAML
jgi:uncharacterized RDD family membrane protein YckC